MLVLVFAGAVGLLTIAAVTGINLRSRRCHHCHERQPVRGLHKIELSGAGVVDVCRDATACRLRHRRALAR